jgi:2-amino-4-hydroxy-6-hydroxymethyldihydropteridine diphosphokinase
MPEHRPAVPIGLGFGSNIGDRAVHIARALDQIEARGIARVTATSSLWRTAPWGYAEQDEFANMCALGESSLAPADLLTAIKKVEADLGRTESVRWGPRVIDIDILFYDNVETDTANLTLPHRELFRRAFVLVPLAEIAPDLVIAGRKIGDAAREIGCAGIKRWNSQAKADMQ